MILPFNLFFSNHLLFIWLCGEVCSYMRCLARLKNDVHKDWTSTHECYNPTYGRETVKWLRFDFELVWRFDVRPGNNWTGDISWWRANSVPNPPDLAFVAIGECLHAMPSQVYVVFCAGDANIHENAGSSYVIPLGHRSSSVTIH